MGSVKLVSNLGENYSIRGTDSILTDSVLSNVQQTSIATKLTCEGTISDNFLHKSNSFLPLRSTINITEGYKVWNSSNAYSFPTVVTF